MLKNKLYEELVRAESCSGYRKRFESVIDRAQVHFSAGELEACANLLDGLPTEEELYEQLLKKLETKRLCQTLRKIDQGVELNHYTKLKALTSLLTHIVIECENGNTEYERLLPRILDAVNVLAFPPLVPPPVIYV